MLEIIQQQQQQEVSKEGSVSRRHYSKRFLSTEAAAAAAEAADTSVDVPFKSEKVKDIFERLTQLPKEELNLISDVINERLGITLTEMELSGNAGMMGSMDQQDSAQEEEEVKVEKTAFDMKLVGFDAKAKIKVIKEVRAITGLGLKEAKELVENAPKVVMKEMKMEQAEELKAKLEAVGAQVEIS